MPLALPVQRRFGIENLRRGETVTQKGGAPGYPRRRLNMSANLAKGILRLSSGSGPQVEERANAWIGNLKGAVL